MLEDLVQLAKDDSKLNNLSKEQEEDLIDSVLEMRQEKVTGVRANNISAAQDVLRTSDRMIVEVSTIHCACSGLTVC